MSTQEKTPPQDEEKQEKRPEKKETYGDEPQVWHAPAGRPVKKEHVTCGQWNEVVVLSGGKKN